MEEKVSSEKALRVINKSEYSIEDFVERISVNAEGNPLLGDCLTYACVFSSVFKGDVFVIYIPDMETAENPMHAATLIGSQYYDARGKVSPEQLINDQVTVIESDFDSYVDNHNISNIFNHVKSNSKHVTVNDARRIPDFNHRLYEKVREMAVSEIKRIEDGIGLSADVTTMRGSDF